MKTREEQALAAQNELRDLALKHRLSLPITLRYISAQMIVSPTAFNIEWRKVLKCYRSDHFQTAYRYQQAFHKPITL